MPHDIALAALPVAMGLLHRLRGGGFVALPFKLTYWLAIPVTLFAWTAGASWPVSLAWGLGYEVWCLFGWMAFLTRAVGAPVPPGQVMASGADVRLIEALSIGSATLACVLCAAVYLVPLGVALACLDLFDGAGPLVDLAPLLLIVMWFLPAYIIGFALRPTDMSSVAEPIVGASWGIAMAISLALAA